MLKHIKPIKFVVFFLCLVPLGQLVYAGFQNDLTANPIEYITHQTGIWTLRFLLLTLAMTPLRVMSGSTIFIRLRRMLGLYTFFYCTLHLVIYFWLDLGLDWQLIIEDVIEHTYVTVGMLAWLLMLPMAITSNKAMIRKLGKQWKRIHQPIYLVIGLGCLHFIWLVKSDITEPLIYTGIGLSLLLFRIAHHYHGQRSQKNGSTNQRPTNQKKTG